MNESPLRDKFAPRIDGKRPVSCKEALAKEVARTTLYNSLRKNSPGIRYAHGLSTSISRVKEHRCRIRFVTANAERLEDV